jgi:hypothetical protein
MNTSDGLSKALEQVRRKNRVDAPAVMPISPEVRTSLKFMNKPVTLPEELSATNLRTPPVLVLWSFDAMGADDNYAGIFDVLANREADLIQQDGTGKPRYIGTYFKFLAESGGDTPFTTVWSCQSVGEIESLGNFDEDSPASGAFAALSSFIRYETLKQTISVRGVAKA